MIDKEQIRSALTKDIIITIMSSLGAEDYRVDRDGNLLFRTICHGGSKFKLYYYPNYNHLFKCYTDCGCSYDIYELVMKVKLIDFAEALRYVASFVDISVARKGFQYSGITEDWRILNKYKILKRRSQQKTLTVHSEKVLDFFDNYYYQKWLDEGISIDTIDKFKVRYDIVRNKIIIPHFDIDGNLVGIKGRSLQQEEIEAGYKYLPFKLGDVEYSYEQNYNLYGLNITANNIRKYKKAVIFESEKSVMQLETFYGEQNCSVATCNSNISQFQKQLLLDLDVEEVTIAFDKEYTQEDYDSDSSVYLKYCNKIMKFANMFSAYCKTYICYDASNLLGYKDSPSDKGKEVFEYLMENRQLIEQGVVG